MHTVQWSAGETKHESPVVLSVTRDNKCAVLPTREAQLGLGIQGFYWGLVM